MRPDPLETEWAGHPQRTGKSPPALREVETCQVGVQMRPPAGQAAANIGQELPVHHDDTQQVGPRRPGPTTNTGPNRTSWILPS